MRKFFKDNKKIENFQKYKKIEKISGFNKKIEKIFKNIKKMRKFRVSLWQNMKSWRSGLATSRALTVGNIN